MGAAAVVARVGAGEAAERVRTVLVVDDSAFMRQVVAELVDACPGFHVIGTARDGDEALRQVRALAPDVVTLDVEMPGHDGIDALTAIMRHAPRPVVMLTAARDGAHALRALELGAVDLVLKPSGPISLDLATVRERLHDALRAAAATNAAGVRPSSPRAERPAPPARAASTAASRLVVIAASTGGPSALAQLAPDLPRAADLAYVVVQHMPATFTDSFARRLDAHGGLRAAEARDGEPLLGDRLYLAPGGHHLRVARDAAGAPCLTLADDGALWGVRPAADPLFASAAAVFGPAVLGVVLTGMGRDGAAGARAVRAAGGFVVVQDPASCVVGGMPRAVLDVAGADRVAPLDALATTIDRLLARLPARAGESGPAA